ncbi:MAG TPA: PD-(D/E)XK nuclease family protein, partial [Actinoplanes sp.]|nr:PD-(D/E)XK nuclease family protein [Actinoplanes sp.]
MTVTTEPQPVPADAPRPPEGPSLSPSRAADFKTCPLLFRFRTIDRLPERPSAHQVRGTLVHAVLERLFDLPAADRTLAAAEQLVEPEWHRLVEQEPELADLFAEVPIADLAPPPPAHPPAAGPAPEPGLFPIPAAGVSPSSAAGVSLHPAASPSPSAAFPSP